MSRQAESAPEEAEAVGKPHIPDYEVLRKIGEGSYGDVWLARSVTGIFRAIKIIRRDRFDDSEPFDREFRGLTEFASISLANSGLMALLHVGRSDGEGFFYYVMELADDAEFGGEILPDRYVPYTLQELRKRRRRLAVPECLDLAIQLAAGLEFLHARNLIHRDIKPSNVILIGGVPKLSDIGLVVSTEAARTFVGTAGFVAPEGPVAASSDVFSLGKLLYELSTGLDRQKFPSLPDNFGSLQDRGAFLRLNDVILRACEPIAANRYQTAGLLLQDLKRVQQGRTIEAHAPRQQVPVSDGQGLARASSAGTPPGPAGGRGVRRRTILAGGLFAALLLAAWLFGPFARRAPPPGSVAANSASILPRADSHSIAALPFDNLSPDPETEGVADVLHTEIINALARNPELKVSSRAATLGLAAGNGPVTELARRLGVAKIVSGSIRRDGSQLRIQVLMRDLNENVVLWSHVYDGGVTDPQSMALGIADELVRMIQLRESRGAYAYARFATKDAVAYDLFKKGWTVIRPSNASAESIELGIELAEESFHLDPQFAPALVLLAQAHAKLFAAASDPDGRNRQAVESRDWAEKASSLAPDGAGDLGLAMYCDMVANDYARAGFYADNALRVVPNEALAYDIKAMALSAGGQLSGSIPLYRRAISLEPGMGEFWENLLAALAQLRRRADWNAAMKECRTANPERLNAARVAESCFVLTGETPRDVSTLPRSEQAVWLWRERRFQDELNVVEELLAEPDLPVREQIALLLRESDAAGRVGRAAEGAKAAARALAIAGTLPVAAGDDSTGLAWLAESQSRMDRPAEAIANARRFMQAETRPGTLQFRREIKFAEICARLRRPDDCMPILSRLVGSPSGLTVAMLNVDPVWDPLRDSTAFKAIVADSRNSKPF